MTISAEEVEEARDQAANFVLDKLADALDVKDWTPCDGTETWEGDVAGSVYSILRQARVLDPDTDELATSRIAALEAQLAEAVAALEPFAKEESTWANSVADDYRPGLVEPNQRTAYSKAEFSIGDLRRAAAIRAAL